MWFWGKRKFDFACTASLRGTCHSLTEVDFVERIGEKRSDSEKRPVYPDRICDSDVFTAIDVFLFFFRRKNIYETGSLRVHPAQRFVCR